MNDYLSQIIRELAKSKEFITNNWSDSIGKQYLTWLANTEEKIKSAERKNEMIQLRKQKIQILCDDATKSGEDESPKVLKRTRK